MPNFGAWEWIILLTIVIVVFVVFAAILPAAIAAFLNEIKKSL